MIKILKINGKRIEGTQEEIERKINELLTIFQKGDAHGEKYITEYSYEYYDKVLTVDFITT